MKKSILTIVFLLTGLGISQAQAAQVNLKGGEAITIQANVATTVTCGGNAAPEKVVVAKNCFCADGIYDNKYRAIMTLVYSDGSTTDVVVQKIDSSTMDAGKKCAAAAEKACANQ